MSEFPAADKFIADLVASTHRLLELGADAVVAVVFDVPVPTPILFGVMVDGVASVGCHATGRREILAFMASLNYDEIDTGRSLDRLMEPPPPSETGCTTRLMGMRASKAGVAPWNPDVSFPPEPIPNVRL